MKPKYLFVALLAVILAGVAATTDKGRAQKVKIIAWGDIHGHIEPHENVRSDGSRGEEGGLARIATVLKKLRKRADRQNISHYTLLVGDMTQGGVETAFSSGEAVLSIVNKMGTDYFAPGNWDFVNGTCRTHEMWNFRPEALVALNAKPQLNCTVPTAPGRSRANFEILAANAYVDNDRNSANCPPVDDRIRLFNSYKIITDPKTQIKIGLIGFTTERGPRVIGNPVVEGLCFTKGDEEIVELVTLMNQKRAAGEVDAVVMISELNIANNRRVIDLVDDTLGAGGVDLVLSADMHEETPQPLVTKNGTLIVEQGQDGQNVGDITLKFRNKKLESIKFEQVTVNEKIKKDPEIAAMVNAVRAPYVDGTLTATHFVHGRQLPRRIDDPSKGMGVEEQLAIAGEDFSRNNYTHQRPAALFEGSGHSLVTDSMREIAQEILAKKLAQGNLDQNGVAAELCQEHQSDGKCLKHLPVVSVIRGFRYTTAIEKGHSITLEDIYHYIPIGPFAAMGVVTGDQIRGRGVISNADPTAGGIENSARSALNPDVRAWGGGWLFNWSGLKYKLNPYADKDRYTVDPLTGADTIKIGDKELGFVELDDAKKYIIIGYSFDRFLFGAQSGAPELQFINKPFKARFVTPNIYRVVYTDSSKSTLDATNELDIVATPFTVDAGPSNSLPMVDLVARRIYNRFGAQSKRAKVEKPKTRVKVLCPLPNLENVVNTASGQIVDANFPLIDVGFPMIQPIFGGNKNLFQYLRRAQKNSCKQNGIDFSL